MSNRCTFYIADPANRSDNAPLVPFRSVVPRGERWKDDTGVEWIVNGTHIREPNDSHEYEFGPMLGILRIVDAALDHRAQRDDWCNETRPIDRRHAIFRYEIPARSGRNRQKHVLREAAGDVLLVASSVLEETRGIIEHLDATAPPAPAGQQSDYGSVSLGTDFLDCVAILESKVARLRKAGAP